MKHVSTFFSLRFFFFLSLLVAGSMAPPLRAEEPSEKFTSLSTASLTCDYMEYRSSDNAVNARGHAVAVSSGTQLEADEMTLFLSSQVIVAQGRSVLLSSGTRLEADELTLYQTRREAVARGHVFLQDQDLSVMADNLHYNWGDSTGEFDHIFIQQGAWRTWGRRLVRLSPTHYRIERAAFSSCESTPPHYHFRAGSAQFWVRDRMSATNIRAAADRTAFLYTPYYTRSLKDNRWTYTVDPGHSARNGWFAKNVFTYPFGDAARGKLIWDYYSRAGHGLGAEYSYSSSTVRGSLSGYQIKDRIDQRRRWNLRLAHWQQLAPRWQVQSHMAMQSDQNVNNEFIGDDFQRVRQLGESDVAFTRTGSWYTARIFAEHDRALDPIQNRFVTAKTILPQLGFQSSALRVGKSNAYVSLGGNFRNEYDRPEKNPPATDPILPGKDSYRQYADGTGRLTWRLPLTRTMSLEPSVGVEENWQSHRDKGDELDSADITRGKGLTGLNFRHRLTRNLDYDVGHHYRVRWTANTFRREHGSPDKGIEQNALDLLTTYRPSSALWGRAFASYDLRDSPSGPVSLAAPYVSPRQRLSPPSLDAGWSPRRWISMTGRETVQLYPTRKPQSSVFDVRVGPDDRAFFSTGFSYNVGRRGELDVSHGAAFHLTPGWWLSGDVHYAAAGPGGVHYKSVTFKEKNLVIRRDLHCWVMRVTYKEQISAGRSGIHEVFFRFDLKTNMDLRNKGRNFDDKQFYPARDNRGL